MPRVEAAADDDGAVMRRVRAYLIERCERSVARHAAADTEVYDFSPRRCPSGASWPICGRVSR